MLASKLARFVFAAALALSASSASATVTKCQGKFEKAGTKFAATVSKSLQKCIDGVQKAIDGGDPLEQKQADTCEKAIDKINAARTKTLDGCMTAGCTNAELSALGHLLSGLNGPQGIGDSAEGIAAGTADFACAAAVSAAESFGFQNTVQDVGTAQSLLLAAVGADVAATATDLTAYVTALPRCNTHACVLTASSATLTINFGGSPTGVGPLPVSGAVPIDICTPVGGVALGTDAKIIRSAPSRSVKPVVGLPGGLTACPTTIRAEGACDCGPTVGWSKDYALCRDSDLDDNAGVDDCSVAPYGAGAGYSDTGLAPDGNGGNVWNSPAPTGMVVATGNGDCTGSLSVSFKVVAPAEVGTDTVACTNDDTAAAGAAQGLPFTTGTARASVPDGQNPGNNVTGETDLDSGLVTGAAIAACTSLQSSNLAGLKLVGAAPVLDDGDSTLGDNVIALTLTCN